MVIRRISWRETIIRAGSKFGVEQRDIAVKNEIAVWTFRAPLISARTSISAAASKPVYAHPPRCRSKSIRQTDFANLILKGVIETAHVEIEVGQRLSAEAQFELKGMAFLQIAVDHTVRARGD